MVKGKGGKKSQVKGERLKAKGGKKEHMLRGSRQNSQRKGKGSKESQRKERWRESTGESDDVLDVSNITDVQIRCACVLKA